MTVSKPTSKSRSAKRRASSLTGSQPSEGGRPKRSAAAPTMKRILAEVLGHPSPTKARSGYTGGSHGELGGAPDRNAEHANAEFYPGTAFSTGGDVGKDGRADLRFRWPARGRWRAPLRRSHSRRSHHLALSLRGSGRGRSRYRA